MTIYCTPIHRATDEPTNFLDHVMGTVRMEKSGYRRSKLRLRGGGNGGGGVVIHGMERELNLRKALLSLLIQVDACENESM